VITRVLGTDPDVDVDTVEVDAREGDVFVICSDGLNSMVEDKKILEIVERRRSNLEQAARALVDAANRGGGEDNSSVVLFEIGEPDAGDTATIAAPIQADDDEQTLSELDGVPAVDGDTLYLSRDELEAMAAPSGRPKRHRTSKVLVGAGAAIAVILFAAAVVWSLSRSYFVGVQPNGHIAVYQGFPWNIVGNVRLYRVRYESPVLAGQLSRTERRKLFDHDLRSYERALGSVKAYEAEVVP